MKPDARLLDELVQRIEERRHADPERSYTARLLTQGRNKIARKLGEEALEAVIAALAEGSERLAEESADLLYHLLVLWAACDLPAQSVWAKLAQRQERSGLAEKAARAPEEGRRKRK